MLMYVIVGTHCDIICVDISFYDISYTYRICSIYSRRGGHTPLSAAGRKDNTKTCLHGLRALYFSGGAAQPAATFATYG